MTQLRALLSKARSLHETRIELDNSRAFISIRWLVFLGLICLALYNTQEDKAVLTFGIAGAFGVINLALMYLVWTSRYPFPSSPIVIFFTDVSLITGSLYTSIGLDTDLYLICFLIIYLSTLGRQIRDSAIMAFVAMLLYIALVWKQNPGFDFMDPKFLLRFPFLFILSLFTTYLSSEAEKNRRKASQFKDERDRVVTELDKKQAALIQAEKLTAMGHMAGAMAHEIRNPLCVILGYTGEILEATAVEPQHRRFLETIQRCATRCNELAEKLLRFSRQPKENEQYSLKEAVEEAAALAKLGRKSFNLRLHLELNYDTMLWGRRNELQQIIVNLCTNAIDAMPNGGTLSVRTYSEERATQPWAAIEVQDTGTGIPDAFLKQIFNPFFTTKPAGTGTGLGLSIVRDILRATGGTIDVQSTVGKGTTFTVRVLTAISERSDHPDFQTAA
jgi:signal transduction histidine kinase